MFQIFFLIFIIVPVIEFYLFIKIGSLIGTGVTVAIIIATAIIGSKLLKHQGLSTLHRAQENLRQNKIPASELIEGIALLVSGAFLITPGFFTDTVGFTLLIPYVRQIIAKSFISKGKFHIYSTFSKEHGDNNNEDIIEGEFKKETNHSEKIDHKND